MNSAMLLRAQDVPVATQDLIVRTANSIGFEAKPVAARTQRVGRSGADYIFPSHFVPVYRECMTALYRASMSSLDTAHANAVPTTDEVELFCACLIHCENLEEVIAKAMRFARFFNNRGESLALCLSGDEVQFHMHTHKKNRTAPALICDLFGLSFFSKLFGWLIGEPLPLTRVGVVYQPLIPTAISEHIVNSPVQFEAATNLFSFDRGMLHRPVVRTHRELIDLLRGAPFELVALESKATLSDQLERIFKKLLLESAELPSLEQIAHLVGQTVSTLRRHLAQDGTSYQNIIDRCRMERAMELLQQPALTVDEISAHLGYSASSSFSRAFKDWTGCAPSYYRQAMATSAAATASAEEI